MPVLKALAVVVFIGLSGLAVATLLVSRGPFPAEVSGSPTPPEHFPRTVGNVLAGGDFVTRAADGEAYVLIRYSSPEAFTQFVHAYRSETWPQYRINTAALQLSDDGTNWTDVAEASDPDGEFVFDLRKAGSHKFWKMTVVKSGDAPEVVFGEVSFVKSGNLLRSVPVDAAWLGLLPASLLILIAFRIPLSFGRVFTATALPVTLFVLAYSLGYVDLHTIVVPDSLTYLERVLHGSYSPVRSPGYPIILLVLQKITGLNHLAIIQLGAGIACYLGGAYLLAVRFGNKWIGAVLALTVLFQGTTSQFAPDVMTEALFTAGLGLFAAALGALAWRPDRPAVVAAVAGIILATLAKSTGVVLILPAILLIRFLPRGKRLSVSGAIVIAGLGTYGSLAVSNFTRTGVLSPESIAGFALLGHVGWMLDDTYMPPSDLTRSLIDAAAPVIEQRPAELTNIHSLVTLDRYVDVTAADFNTVLWAKLVPILAQLGTAEAINSFALRLGISSIRAHPLAYLRHVAAHFYGMWRDLGKAMPLRQATIYMRIEPLSLAPQLDPALFKTVIPATVIKPFPSESVSKGEIFIQSQLPLMFRDMWDSALILTVGPLTLGALALFLSILALIPGRLAHVYRTEVMIALSLNAYIGSHVMLQVTLQRYAAAGTLPAVFLALSFVFTSLYVLKSLIVAAWANWLAADLERNR